MLNNFITEKNIFNTSSKSNEGFCKICSTTNNENNLQYSLVYY